MIMIDEDRRIFGQLLAQFDGPAFIRRARDVQLAFDALVESCRCQRDEWLTYVRFALGSLFALAGSSSALATFLNNPEQLQTLEALNGELKPNLRVPPNPTTNPRVLRRAL